MYRSIQISTFCVVFFRMINDFLKIVQPILMAFFSFGIISICCTILIIEMELVQFMALINFEDIYKFIYIQLNSFFFDFQSKPEINFVPLTLAIVDAFDYYAVVFVICELSQRITNKYEEIFKLTDQLNWYLFSNGIKKMIPTTLIMLQQPVEIKCFGSFSSNRESFKWASTCVQYTHHLCCFILSFFSLFLDNENQLFVCHATQKVWLMVQSFRLT